VPWWDFDGGQAAPRIACPYESAAELGHLLQLLEKMPWMASS
jgi:hypothetical protein